MGYKSLWLRVTAVLVVIFPAGGGLAWAKNSTQIFTFEKEKLQFDRVSNYDLVRYEGLELSSEVSAPQLPVKPVHLALPPGKNIANILVKAFESEELSGLFDVFPVQTPQVLSRPVVRFTAPSGAIYSSSDAYPENIVKIGPHGYFSGYNVGALLVYPLQYVPSQKKLIFFSQIEVEITYGDSDKGPVPFKTTAYSETICREVLKKLTINPHSLTRPGLGKAPVYSPLPDEEHLYVIITDEDFVDSFDPLAYWKTRKGLSAKIVATSWIYGQYAGPDNPAKIREFIKDAHQNWGTLWILLGGDVNIVPERRAFAMDCEMGYPDHNYIPCDLYYSDLDLNWNANGNDVYGEVGDYVDMYPDVFVGRAPVKNIDEVVIFSNKVMIYEMVPPHGHETDMLFLAEILWDDPYTDSGRSKDFIDSLYVPDRFAPVSKLYESQGSETRTAVLDAFNAGQNIINHAGHAWYTGLGIGDGYLQRPDADALTNHPRYSILFSIGCWPAAIDYDCVGEHLLNSPNGGASAFIGNSRYGWGSPGNPLYGYSDRFDQQFFKSLFEDGIYHIGHTLAAAKSAYVGFAGEANVYRWCEYEITLLGDPEMSIWTDTPRPLALTVTSELPTGTSVCPVTVSDGQNPVEGALVCVMQTPDVYETGFTDYRGYIRFDVSTTDITKPVLVTVTAHNFIPHTDSIQMMTDEPHVQICSYAANGSAAGYVSPGDPVSVDVCFKNYGNDMAREVSAVLRSGGGKIVLMDSMETLGDIPPGDSAVVAGAFSFQAGTDLHDGEVIQLNAEIADTSGNVWTDFINLTGTAPELSCSDMTVYDYQYGDGDGFAEPTETVTVKITVRNTGLRAAQSVCATLGSTDPGVGVLSGGLVFGDIPPGGQKQSPALVAVDASCPAPSFPQLDLALTAQGGYQFEDSFLLSVGEIGFEDDMENGEGYWTHTGVMDLWHLTSHRVHSGDSAWYCGVEGGYVYPHNMDNTLELAPVEIGQDAVLSFWCWYQLTTYGVDGLYVEVNDGSGWTTLDFIGSGGALGTLPIGNTWLEYRYDLSSLPAGTQAALRFRFVSDATDIAEGVYVDDVEIVGSEWPENPGAPIPVLDGRGLLVVILLLLGSWSLIIRRRKA